MDAGAVAALIPVVAVGGFFAWLIVLAVSRGVHGLAKIQAERQVAPDAGAVHEVLAAVDELRREVAELAERVDFTERLLGQRGADRLGPPRP